jgi:hypothetical protein
MLGFTQSFLFLVDLLDHDITLTDSQYRGIGWYERIVPSWTSKFYDFFGGQSS